MGNKLTYMPDKIYKMGFYKGNSYGNFYVSIDDLSSDELKDGDNVCIEVNNKLFFESYYNVSGQGLACRPFVGISSLINKYTTLVKSDSIDIKEGDRLITTLTLTGLKRKDNGQRDFVGEIACYQNELIKVDRTNANNPTVQFLSFENSQYKDNYEREERMKLIYFPFDIL